MYCVHHIGSRDRSGKIFREFGCDLGCNRRSTDGALAPVTDVPEFRNASRFRLARDRRRRPNCKFTRRDHGSKRLSAFGSHSSQMSWGSDGDSAGYSGSITDISCGGYTSVLPCLVISTHPESSIATRSALYVPPFLGVTAASVYSTMGRLSFCGRTG